MATNKVITKEEATPLQTIKILGRSRGLLKWKITPPQTIQGAVPNLFLDVFPQ